MNLRCFEGVWKVFVMGLDCAQKASLRCQIVIWEVTVIVRKVS